MTTAESKLTEQLAIRGFRSFTFFKGDVNVVKDFVGGRTSAQIDKWVVKKPSPAVKIVASA